MTDQNHSIPQHFTVPSRFMVWHSMPNLSHIGTWSTERYPEEAVEAVRADTIPALLAEARAEGQRELFSAWIRRDGTGVTPCLCSEIDDDYGDYLYEQQRDRGMDDD